MNFNNTARAMFLAGIAALPTVLPGCDSDKNDQTCSITPIGNDAVIASDVQSAVNLCLNKKDDVMTCLTDGINSRTQVSKFPCSSDNLGGLIGQAFSYSENTQCVRAKVYAATVCQEFDND